VKTRKAAEAQRIAEIPERNISEIRGEEIKSVPYGEELHAKT
jgi:hypothetical protein